MSYYIYKFLNGDAKGNRNSCCDAPKENILTGY